MLFVKTRCSVLCSWECSLHPQCFAVAKEGMAYLTGVSVFFLFPSFKVFYGTFLWKWVSVVTCSNALLPTDKGDWSPLRRPAGLLSLWVLALRPSCIIMVSLGFVRSQMNETRQVGWKVLFENSKAPVCSKAKPVSLKHVTQCSKEEEKDGFI